MAKQNNVKQKAASGAKSLEKRAESIADFGSNLAASPFDFMRRFGEEMDRLFGEFGFGRGWLTPGEAGWAPQVEMFERDGKLIMRADLPGLTKDDVKVEIADGAITIEGERRSEQKENGEGFYRSERSYGKFYRRLPLPEGVDASDDERHFQQWCSRNHYGGTEANAG